MVPLKKRFQLDCTSDSAIENATERKEIESRQGPQTLLGSQ